MFALSETRTRLPWLLPEVFLEAVLFMMDDGADCRGGVRKALVQEKPQSPNANCGEAQ